MKEPISSKSSAFPKGIGLREPVNSNELSPVQLSENQGLAFTGTYVNGEGFFLTPAQAKKIITNSSPETSQVIRQHTNGRDLYSSPIQSGSRYVIDFAERSQCQAQLFSSVFDIIESEVKPIRLKQTDKSNRENWWLHARRRPELYAKIHDFETVLVCARVSSTCAISFVSANQVLDEKLVVFAMPGYDSFALLQSCFHWEWVWFRCTTMKNDVTYGVQRVFETLPMPRVLPSDTESLAAIGERYHEFRRDLMLRLWLGLTDIYNLFHAPDPDLDARLAKLFTKREKSPDWQAAASVPPEHRATAGTLTPDQARDAIHHLRTLHRELDYTVLEAYGWAPKDWRTANGEQNAPSKATHASSSFIPQPSPLIEIVLSHDFYAIETLPENDRTRYTITPESRKELLTRLLKLNHYRAAEEARCLDEKSGGNRVAKKSRATQQRMKSEDELI